MLSLSVLGFSVCLLVWCSGIVNFQDWAVTDIPGQGNLDLNTFLCKQPVSVVVYDFTAASASVTAHKARWVPADYTALHGAVRRNDFCYAVSSHVTCKRLS